MTTRAKSLEGDDEEDDDSDAEDARSPRMKTIRAVSPEASDDEVMLSDDDEFAEDEGDEIAEIDRIHAGGQPRTE